jgi:hypothetical protein
LFSLLIERISRPVSHRLRTPQRRAHTLNQPLRHFPETPKAHSESILQNLLNYYTHLLSSWSLGRRVRTFAVRRLHEKAWLLHTAGGRREEGGRVGAISAINNHNKETQRQLVRGEVRSTGTELSQASSFAHFRTPDINIRGPDSSGSNALRRRPFYTPHETQSTRLQASTSTAQASTLQFVRGY